MKSQQNRIDLVTRPDTHSTFTDPHFIMVAGLQRHVPNSSILGLLASNFATFACSNPDLNNSSSRAHYTSLFVKFPNGTSLKYEIEMALLPH